MWSFPIVSIALGLLSWNRTKIKFPLIFLMVGLALQAFSYLDLRVAPGLSNHGLVALGKGLFVGLLYVLYTGMGHEDKTEVKTRVEMKSVLLVGMIFLTLSNLLGPKVSEAFLAIACIFFPALFWNKFKDGDVAPLAAAITLAFMAFLSFILTWSEYLIDFFKLSPILWLISFASGFFIFLSLEESK